MIFFLILIIASSLTALILRYFQGKTRGGGGLLRPSMRVGLILSLAFSGTTLLATGGWEPFLSACTITDCLFAEESDPVFRLLDAVLLVPRSLVPVSGLIVVAEFSWRLVSGATSPLTPFCIEDAGHFVMRSVDLFVISWALFVADESGVLTKRVRSLATRSAQRIERAVRNDRNT